MGSRRISQSSIFSRSLHSILDTKEEQEDHTRPRTADNSSICPRTADSFSKLGGKTTRRVQSTESHESISSRRHCSSSRSVNLGQARLEARRIGNLAIQEERLRQGSLRDNSFIRQVRVFRKINESNGWKEPGFQDIVAKLKSEMHSKYRTGFGVLRATINELDSELSHQTEENFEESLLHASHPHVHRSSSPETRSQVSIGRSLRSPRNRS